MILKQRPTLSLGMILGGVFVSWLGFGPLFGLGLYKEFSGLILGIVGILGLLWLIIGVWTLAKRNQLIIAIDDAGIRVPTGNLFRPGSGFIPRQNIATVSKRESMKGRLIEVTLKSGQKVSIQARHYCDLDQFLSHCRSNGFPVA